MDMNFPHDSIERESASLVDFDAIRASIIASASTRQVSSETARKLQKSVKAQSNSTRSKSISPLKARIIFFSKAQSLSVNDDIYNIVTGSFFPTPNIDKGARQKASSKYESGVNPNNSNNVKSSQCNSNNDDANIADKVSSQ